MSIIQNIKMSVSEGLICETLYGHTFDIRLNNRHGCFLGVQLKGFELQHSVDVTKLFVERGFLVL